MTRLADRLMILGIDYQVVGIDSYLLHNYLGQSRQWQSYTLQNSEHRHGLTSIDGRTVLWRPVPSPDHDWATGLRLNLALSGTATITIDGDPGPSTPLAQLLWFETTEPQKIFANERFLHLAGAGLQRVSDHYYTGQVIDG